MAIQFKVTFDAAAKAREFETKVRPVVQRRTPVDSGKLRQANKVFRSANSVTIANNKDYAAPVHEGSRPHKIVPRKANALRFTIGTKVIYAKSVWHPGTTANPYIEASIFETLEAIGVKNASISKEIRI